MSGVGLGAVLPLGRLSVRDRVNRPTSIYLWYPHGYSAERKHRAQADSGHEPLKRFIPCYRDNRAELSTTWTVPINYPDSGNPVQISYVM